ncbi:hypothetical protein PG985_016264 [Apiospora marii]|uniref:Uncharacterized protein n=1 Tax=Apiospora marii TaxID=335849 RepID=A0ABR1STZ3_9PEZI
MTPSSHATPGGCMAAVRPWKAAHCRRPLQDWRRVGGLKSPLSSRVYLRLVSAAAAATYCASPSNRSKNCADIEMLRYAPGVFMSLGDGPPRTGR